MKSGDIFSIKTKNGRYIFGRIILDLKEQCFESELLNENSHLDQYKNCFIVSGYNCILDNTDFSVSKLALSSFFVDRDALENDVHEVIKNETVNLIDIDFPMYLVNTYFKGIFFEWGELRIPIDLSTEEFNDFVIRGGVHYEGAFEEAMLPLILNSGILESSISMKYEDIRHSSLENQNKIYSLINEDMTRPYHEIAKKHGFDTSRFYE